ncbi:hypothetical protein M427DRAFT_27483 [Gonapodya prolifera JEL478]|uniref:Uncharacterized protein n=1 Tax=Gonapodya prolifera (strain JEL478) TaxID=1344416 RepID=A0A139AZG7_GONPJ|nr:hypothetical protein M427DRAFT_27483 [Gonapodya prolifera JEL478]|eukprot:KXS21953.1 hypothetical protein M427DRAFT_27483 [Gonapodya prolifera JEL478]
MEDSVRPTTDITGADLDVVKPSRKADVGEVGEAGGYESDSGSTLTHNEGDHDGMTANGDGEASLDDHPRHHQTVSQADPHVAISAETHAPPSDESSHARESSHNSSDETESETLPVRSTSDDATLEEDELYAVSDSAPDSPLSLSLSLDDPARAEAERIAARGLPVVAARRLAPEDDDSSSPDSSTVFSSSPSRSAKKPPSIKSTSSLKTSTDVPPPDCAPEERKMVRRVSFHDGPPDVTEAPDYWRRSDQRPEPVGLIDTVKMMRYMSKMRKMNVEEQQRRAQSLPPRTSTDSTSEETSTAPNPTTRPRALTLPSRLSEDIPVSDSDVDAHPRDSVDRPSIDAKPAHPHVPAGTGADVSWDGKVTRGRKGVAATAATVATPTQQTASTSKPKIPTALSRLLKRSSSPAGIVSGPATASTQPAVPAPTFPPKKGDGDALTREIADKMKKAERKGVFGIGK